MLTGISMFLHALVCAILIAVILMQSGRGGGLTESFSSAESMFGAQTNEFMVKATSVFAIVFLVTCLSLAIVSSRKSESLMSNKVAMPALDDVVADVEKAAEEAASQAEAK